MIVQFLIISLFASSLFTFPPVSWAATHEHMVHGGVSPADKTPHELFEELALFFINITRSLEDFFAGKAVPGSHKAPPTLNEKELYTKIKQMCPKTEFQCVAKILREITAERGLKMASNVLKEFESEILTDPFPHLMGHEIGEQAAESFGFSPKLFFECPIDEFNAGCQHGLFMYAIPKGLTTIEAAESLCEYTEAKKSKDIYTNCYYGVAHGIILANHYDMDKSVNDCNQLAAPAAKHSCIRRLYWDGVLHLLKAGPLDIKKAQDFCMQSSDDLVRHGCFRGIGWSVKLRLIKNDLVRKACSELEEGEFYQSECYEGASVALDLLEP